MNMDFFALVLCILSVTVVTISSASKISKDELCGACLGLFDEMNNEIKQVDPKKTIKVGSFRVDGQGNQPHVREVPFATSEENLHEMVENICGKFYNYAKLKEEGKTEPLCVRSSSRDLTSYRTLGIETDRDLGLRLKRACGNIIDDHEEEVITMYNKNEEDIDIKLCKDISDLCSAETIQRKRDFLAKEPEMVAEAQAKEEEERKVREEEDKKRAEEEKKKAEEEATKKAEDDKDNDDDDDDDKKEPSENADNETITDDKTDTDKDEL